MQRKRAYHNTIFDAESIRDIFGLAEKEAGRNPKRSTYYINQGRDSITYDTRDQLLAAMRQPFDSLSVTETYQDFSISLDVENFIRGEIASRASVFHETSDDFTLRYLRKFDEHEHRCVARKVRPKIFIGHGRKPDWLSVRSHLHDLHHLDVVAFEIESRAGLPIPDVIHEMSRKSSFAVIVMAREDEWADGSLHARENVIHELGLCQGRLGITRTIALVEEGTSVFSNIIGHTFLPYPIGRIQLTFGDILAAIRREFPEALTPSGRNSDRRG